MSDLVSKIEAKISELQNQVKSHGSYINEIAAAIEKMTADKATSSNNINIINGAIQAYTDIMNVLKASESAENDGNANG
jgi:hypothetical protein